jgi:hypothetical protein
MDILKTLQKLNAGHHYKIRCQINRKKKSLYIDNNTISGRKCYYPGLSISGNDQDDRKAINVAREIRDKMEYEAIYTNAGITIIDPKAGKVLLSDFTKAVVKNMKTHVREFYVSGGQFVN